MPAIEPKRVYTKPRVKTIDIQSNRTGKLVNLPDGKTIYGQDLTLEEYTGAKKLFEKGIAVEPIFGKYTKLVFFKNGGVTLRSLLKSENLNNAQKRSLLLTYVKLVAKMHNAGFEHGHPHFWNVVVDSKGNMRFIDFKLLNSRIVNWTNHNEIWNAFINDYSEIAMRLRFVGVNKNDAQMIFKKLVSYYNCIPQVKNQLLNCIIVNIINNQYNG
jgi:hypothetical protein